MLSGTIPASIGKMTQLVVLDLSNNKLQGTIPPAILSLPNLEYLNLAGNDLVGTIPPIFATNLSTLDLERNKLFGTLPSTLSTLKKLSGLRLSYNDLYGPYPDNFDQLTSLRSLEAYGNGLSGGCHPLSNWAKNDTLKENLTLCDLGKASFDCACSFDQCIQASCYDADPCVGNTMCESPAFCESSILNPFLGIPWQCGCPAGYNQIPPWRCEDISECALYGCGDSAKCTEFEPNQRTCTCLKLGFGFNGQQSTTLIGSEAFGGCSDIDECEVSGCGDSLATCMQSPDFPNSRNCTCPSGTYGTATLFGDTAFGGCNDIDECETLGCGPYA
eukprot:TRINITY_DN802_c0_g3_i3.p1 TRINITY_DN802_c0_g3~~TRINITY_DN802_c0_g3_i3.p1  ORF type:complete len:331 (-),score=45.74 TRINITY_DN802_c0_g3_i3:962-1954(-)